jgi:hypothetical protein
MANTNIEVTQFLNSLNHPFRKEIELLRFIILGANDKLTENIKWNGPNYCFSGEDRITMRIQPPKQVQIIFHRGAKVKEQPQNRLLINDFGILTWKENDRAIATFKSMEEINNSKLVLAKVVEAWIIAAN